MSYFVLDIFTSIQMIESATSYANSTPGLKSIAVKVDSNDCFWSNATSTTIIKRIVHINLFLVIVGGFFFVAHMIFGKSRPRLNFGLGIWPKGYRRSVKGPFFSRSRLHPTKIIIRPQNTSCKDKLAQRVAHHIIWLNNSLSVNKRNV